MIKLRTILTLALLSGLVAAHATTPVTGNLKDLTGTVVNSKARVRLWLRGCNGNQPRVTGQALIAPTLGATYFKDFSPDVNGLISGTVYSNDVNVECGGSVNVTWYGVQTFVNGVGGPEMAVKAVDGVTLNITSVTPISVTPVSPSGTGPAIVANPVGGASQTIAGPLVVNAINSSGCDVDATTFSGADIISQTLAAMNSAACALNGGQIRIPPNPAGGCWVSTTQLLVPNSGGTNPSQKTFKLQGAGSGGVTEGHGAATPPSSGTCIDLRANPATCAKICTLGNGKLIIQDIGFLDSASDGKPFFQTTNTNVQLFRNEFYGNCALGTKQTGILFGGASAAGVTNGTATDPFQGYGTNVDSNIFDCVGIAAKFDTFANAINFTNNHIFIASGLTTGSGSAIELNPTFSVIEGNVITGNLVEVIGYKYAINLVAASRYNTIIGNSCFDKGGPTLACVNVTAGAGNDGNTIIDGNVDTTLASIAGNTSAIGLSGVNGTCLVHSPQVAGTVDHCGLKKDTGDFWVLDVDGDQVKIPGGTLHLFGRSAPTSLGGLGFTSCYADTTTLALFCSYNSGPFLRMAQVSSNAILAFGCNGVATSSQTLFLDGPGAASYACTNTGGTVQQEVLPSAGTLLNLRVRCQVAGKVAGSGVFTLRKTSGDTTLTCTIGTGTTCSDTTHSATVVAGDFLNVKYTTQATETLANCSVTVEKQ